MPSSNWTVVEATLPALRHRYEFGKGATAYALALVINGSVIVVSPPSNPSEASFTELSAYGPVRAIVAPNGFHTLGLTPWSKRYPDAPVFAPATAIARIQKQTKLVGVRPVAELAPMLSGRVEFVEMPHYKTGEVLVRWKTADGWAWYVTDILFNMTEKAAFPFNVIFKLTKSAPGLRRNGLAQLLMIKDKKALYAWLVEQSVATPPHLLVPSHGEVARLSDPRAAIAAAVL